MYYKYPGARIYNLITPKFRDCHLNCSAIKVNYGEVANELIRTVMTVIYLNLEMLIYNGYNGLNIDFFL